MNVKLYNVAPKLPANLQFLERLMRNVWWCWHPLARELFLRINPSLWAEVDGNVNKFLSAVSKERLLELSRDNTYLRQLKAVEIEFERQTLVEEDYSARKVAYFSMEYGIHESLRIFSGGLGVLSGDHLKAASDLKVPMVAVGLLYRQGYFRQVLDRNGWQMERYPDNEIHNMPVVRARDKNGKSITICVRLLDRDLYAAVWVLWVGNVPLVLLDTEIEQNPPEFREITWRLYGGDKNMRLKQEILLAVGGFKALLAMGYSPEVCHMNEGHAAFLSLARIEDLVQKGYDPDVALEIVWRSNIFTTHTPVPAGNEVFDVQLVRPYLAPLAAAAHLDVDRVIRWGIPIGEREHAGEMSMTVLGLRLANYSNAVSKLHGVVARSMWKHLWPERSVSEIPITSITNGVHIMSWLSNRMLEVFSRYLTPRWSGLIPHEELLPSVHSIPDEQLWMAHELSRQSLVRYARRHLQAHGKSAWGQSGTSAILDPRILTIGFARRFATYKRATMLLRDPERLLRMITHSKTPVQFVFAGKAHPADDGGKTLMQQLIQFAEKHGIQNRLVVLEDYDIAMARHLVQGVDVWLNTPRRPQEASGTSGMKAAINGVLNCSILDGWWDEAYNTDRGWAINGDENLTDPEDCDNYEAQSLFNILEGEVIPCFYDRGANDLPTHWIDKMKHSIAMGLADFSSARMVNDYNTKFYADASKAYETLTADNAAAARKLVEQKKKLVANFGQLHIDFPTVDRTLDKIHVDDEFKVSTQVYLGAMTPEEVEIQAYFGPVNVHNEIISGKSARMEKIEDLGNGNFRYECTVVCDASGRFGLTARITPAGNDWENSVPGFICWPH